MDWKQGLDPEVFVFLAGRYNEQPQLVCLYAIPNCWYSTTCRAHWTWKPNTCCGNGSSSGSTRHTLLFHIVALLCAVPTTLSCSRMVRSRAMVTLDELLS